MNNESIMYFPIECLQMIEEKMDSRKPLKLLDYDYVIISIHVEMSNKAKFFRVGLVYDYQSEMVIPNNERLLDND